MRRISASLAAVVLTFPFLVWSAVAAAERVALATGNTACANAPPLANPLNDAADIGDAPDGLGFVVARLENAKYAAPRRAPPVFT